MVQLYLNNQECDLYGNETIATDYSIAPIGNIATRGGAKSITFKIPLTANNREITESANVIVNSSTLPYSLIPAKLTANGLSQNIEFAQIKSVKDDIEVTLYGSNVDFFSVIKSKKLEDLCLNDLWLHAWTRLNAFGSRTATEGYIYSLIDFHSDSPNSFINDTDAEIDVRGLLPSVFLHSIIDQIITQAGYTAQGDFLADPNYLSVIIPAQRLRDTYLTINQVEITAANTEIVPLFMDAGELGIRLLKGSTVIIEGTNNEDYISLEVTEDLDLPATPTQQRFGMLTVRRAVNLTYYDGTNNTTDPATVSGLTVGQHYTITMRVTVMNTTTTNVIYIHGYEDATQVIVSGGEVGTGFGATFNVLTMLPNMKQSDLLKDTAQKFGLIFQVDNVNRIVHIRQFSEIIANIPNAIDWSDKVDYSEKPEIEFDSGYAQRNTCTYSEDETVIKPAGTDSEILIENDNLEAEKELFESPFAASEYVERFSGVPIAQIKVFTDLDGADEEIDDDLEPRWLIKRDVDFSPSFTYTDGSGNSTASTVPCAYFILPEETFNAGWENNLLDYSTDLIEMIQNFKTVNFLLRLNAADINQLDHFIPVWIELNGQAGCYFYVSQVKQFKVTEKESSDAALVKLP